MVHISLGRNILIQPVHPLHFGQRRERTDITNLRLSTRKHRRAVHSRNDINFCSQRTYLSQFTAVGTLVVFQNHLAHGLFLILINRFSENCQVIFLFCESFFQFLGNISDIFFTNLFFIREYSLFHFFRRYDFLHFFEQFFRNCTTLICVLRFSDFGNNLVDKSDYRLVNLMRFINRLYHFCFGNLIRAGFNHDDFLRSRRYRHLQIALVPLFLRRIYNKFPVQHTHLCHRTGAVKRNI